MGIYLKKHFQWQDKDVVSEWDWGEFPRKAFLVHPESHSYSWHWPTSLVLRMWSLNQQHQQQLETHQKSTFLCSNPDQRIQKLWGWVQQVWGLAHTAGDFIVCSRQRITGLTLSRVSGCLTRTGKGCNVILPLCLVWAAFC
jgi:hypothetical protein